MNLSILIPTRSGQYIQQTVEDLLYHSRAEILVGIDGLQEFKGTIPNHERVRTYVHDVGIGQRAMTNLLAKEATGEYLLKVDSHCSFSQDFDMIMLEQMDARTILAPYLMPLDASAWSINGKKKMSRYCFDTNLVMQYDTENDEENPDTMCLQGSAWMVAKNTYWKWRLGDDAMPSWGGQGPELGIKAFLNGGRCKTTKQAYYGHMFKLKEEDFLYNRGPNPGKAANEQLRRMYLNKSIGPLIERFGYPADWTKEAVDNLPDIPVV